MAEEKRKNPEEVEETLEEIRDEKRKDEKPKPLPLRILSYIFYPFVLIYRGICALIKKIHIPITAKITITFTLLFTFAVVLIDVFIVTSVRSYLASMELEDAAYIARLALTSVALIAISVVVVGALGSLVSQAMLSPIRKMIKKIDNISSDDLTTRLDNVDSQDELRELTDRINTMLDRLEQSFDRQKKFVSDASHELKTPISVIQGYSNLLMRWGKDDPEILNEGIESIARESDNMKRIVEQLLLLAKIGRYMFTPERLNIGEELKGITDGYSLVCKTHKFELVSGKGVTVMLDRNMFTEVVRAVVDNAVKYSDEGTTITVTCDEYDGFAEIDISDRGHGISEDDLPHIFDRFYRCDKARNRDMNSSGLGLTIAKSAIEMMGGEISVKSKLGAGSTFTLRFPVEESKNE